MLGLLVVTPSAVLAVDGFVGASGNSHHVNKDVGFLDCRLYMCQPCRPVATCEWLVQRSFLQFTRICIKAIFFLSLSDIFGRCRGMWMLPNRNVCEISQPCAIES